MDLEAMKVLAPQITKAAAYLGAGLCMGIGASAQPSAKVLSPAKLARPSPEGRMFITTCSGP